jgi:hypothetical protein
MVALGVSLHTQIYHLKFHLIINNHNSGTHRVGKIGLHSITILGYKDGEEGHTQGNPQAPPIPMPTHPYPQFPLNIPQLFPGFVSPPLPPIPQQPQQYKNTSSPRPTLLLAQPVPNPNNKPTQPLHNVEMQAFLTYVISLCSIARDSTKVGKSFG